MTLDQHIATIQQMQRLHARMSVNLMFIQTEVELMKQGRTPSIPGSMALIDECIENYEKDLADLMVVKGKLEKI